MRIEIEPKPDGMQRIYFMFCEEAPDPEDRWVLAQLENCPVPPKRVLQWERDGNVYQVFQYGQCTIGQSMFSIEKHKSIVGRIQSVCRAELECAGLDRNAWNTLISQVALEFHKDARFAVDLNGELAIDVDEVNLLARVLQGLKENADAVA